MGKKRKPHGREEVMAAVLDAAAELFAQHGVAGVSVRDIAARAGVNHGLIHRHFGSKENLRRRTQEKLSSEVVAKIGESSSFAEAMIQSFLVTLHSEHFWRVLARTLLDGELEGDVQGDYPFVRRTVELAAQDQEKGLVAKDIDPKVAVAGLVAMGLGLQVFADYILPATGMEGESQEHLKAVILARWQAFLNPGPHTKLPSI